MRDLTRTLLVWLLMLAVPVQGFAASAMLFCSPSHHQAMSQLSNHHAMQAQHQHGDHANAMAADQTTAAKMDKTMDGKCSACAACCIGSSIVSGQFFNPIVMAGSERIPFIAESFVNYTPEGLDPPPRSFLA